MSGSSSTITATDPGSIDPRISPTLSWPLKLLALIGIAVVMGAEILQGRINMRQAIDARPAWMRWSLYYVGTLTVVLLGAFYGTQTAFIYFRF